MLPALALLFSIPALLVCSQIIPGDRAVALHPGADIAKCLDVRGANFTDGTPVQIFDCNGSNAQTWTLFRGETTVKVHGTNFCLDAGTVPANGVGMKIWTCFDNLPAQNWALTTDDRIALRLSGLCLDLTNGAHVNGNQVQTFQCTDNNVNQVWTVDV